MYFLIIFIVLKQAPSTALVTRTLTVIVVVVLSFGVLVVKVEVGRGGSSVFFFFFSSVVEINKVDGRWSVVCLLVLVIRVVLVVWESEEKEVVMGRRVERRTDVRTTVVGAHRGTAGEAGSEMRGGKVKNLDAQKLCTENFLYSI